MPPNKITITKITNHLKKNLSFPKLSCTGVRYMMKKIMDYSYKRASSIDKRALSLEKIRLFAEIYYLQDYLEDKGYYLIWIDEFHADLSKTNDYNWSQKVVKAVLLKIPKTNCLNYTIAVDNEEILII